MWKQDPQVSFKHVKGEMAGRYPSGNVKMTRYAELTWLWAGE